jgi:anti-sigma B factor antagonist
MGMTSSEDLSIHVRTTEAGPQVVELAGTLDIATSPTVRGALVEAFERVDLSGLEFIDSTGLGALIGGQRRAKEKGGSIALVVPEGQILRLFRITGLLRTFECYPSLEAALRGSPLVEDL